MVCIYTYSGGGVKIKKVNEILAPHKRYGGIDKETLRDRGEGLAVIGGDGSYELRESPAA